MNKGKFKKGLVATVTSVLIAGSLALTSASAAGAATVPNRFYCDPADGWCYQVNGVYQFGLPVQCHWNLSGMAGKPHTWRASSCPTPFGPVVP